MSTVTDLGPQKGLRDGNQYRPGCPDCETRRDRYGSNSGCRRHWLEGPGYRLEVTFSKFEPGLVELLTGITPPVDVPPDHRPEPHPAGD